MMRPTPPFRAKKRQESLIPGTCQPCTPPPPPFCPLFQTFCTVGVHFAQTAVHFAHFQKSGHNRGVLGLGWTYFVYVHIPERDL